MKKRNIAFLAFSAVITLVVNVAAAVYFTPSSSSLNNSDGISHSKPAVSSPVGGEITFKMYGGLSKEEEMFCGAIYDGNKIWLVPYGASEGVSITSAGEITKYSLPVSGAGKYRGGAFDGQNIYFAPYGAEHILQLDPQTGTFTELDGYSTGGTKYCGAVFDGEFVWFIPEGGGKVLCMDSLGEIKEYVIPFDVPQENAFSGAVAANEKIYFVPDTYREKIVVMNRNTGEFSSVGGPLDEGYSGAVFDGDTVYFIPKGKGSVLALDCETFGSRKTGMGDAVPDGASFAGGAFDGRFIWLAPLSGGAVVSYDIFSDAFMMYGLENDESYFSGCFDGTNVWLAPYNAQSPLRISGDNTPPTAMNIYLTTTASVPVSSEFEASDEDGGDTITFHIVKEGKLGTVALDAESGSFTYTPNGTAGKDVFYYNAYDGKNNSNTAAVTVEIIEETKIQTGRYIDLWGHWAEKAANYLTDNSVLLGENVDDFYYFYPDHTMTRAEFAVWANSAFGYQGAINDETLPFNDTADAPEWVRMAASGAYHAGMMAGFPEDGGVYFKPYENLNRAEAMTVLYNVIKPSAAQETPLDFADRDSFPDWSVETFKALRSIGMLKGYDDNTVRPYNNVTRAEAAQLLYEAVRYIEGKGITPERLK